MRRIPPFRAHLLLGVCLLWCTTSLAGGVDSSAPMSRDLLDRAGLEMVWQAKLPLVGKESIDTMLILEDRLHVQSTQNYMWSLDRNTGRTVFAESIKPGNSPMMGLAAYNDRLITVVNNQIVELDKNTGRPQRASAQEVGVVAPVARNSRYFYVPGDDRRLHALMAADMVESFNGAPGDDSLVTSVWADDRRVVVGTETGKLVAMATNMPRILWEFRATGPVAGSIVHDANSFYFACKDACVYRIDLTGPNQIGFGWRHLAEAILDRGPRVAPQAVYQYALYRGLCAIDKQRGTPLWSLPEGLDLLAESGNRAYILTSNKTLAVMDNRTGKCVYLANFGPVAKYAANTTDGKIYVADESGHVACLQPRP
jgi:outer membrane protein assembly factor BamB